MNTNHLFIESSPYFRVRQFPPLLQHKNVIITPQNKYNFVIGVVFFATLAYNKNVIYKH